tara:strand:+ start:819 stop:1634 length:816 start_codon:yes stop_codon:yes gene_type:complete
MKIGLVPMSAKPYHAGHHMLVELAAIGELSDELKSLELPINDVVGVFISFTGRGVRKIKDPNDPRTIKQGAKKIEAPKPGQVPVFGSDMKYIWTNILKPNLKLPANVKLLTPEDGLGPSPLANVHDVCEALKNAVDAGEDSFTVPHLNVTTQTSETVINIYSDDQDIVTNYSDDLMNRLYGSLWKNNEGPAINGVGVPRTATVEISGTKMREYLCNGDISNFSKLLPPLPEKAKKELATILMQSIELGCSLDSRKVKQESLLREYIRAAIF